MEVWRLRSPTTCHLQARDPAELVSAGKFNGLRTGAADDVNPSLGANDEVRCPSSNSQRGRKGLLLDSGSTRMSEGCPTMLGKAVCFH